MHIQTTSLILAAAAILAVAVSCAVLLLGPGGRHARNWRKAGRIRERLNAEAAAGGLNPGRVLGYLRRIDPFVFEELTLLCMQKRWGAEPIRNRRYTGDGGIDGRVKIDGRMHLVQCKRYRGHISVAHVRDFAALCARTGIPGYFVHTGRTGGASWKVCRDAERTIRIISGRKLVNLVIDPENRKVMADGAGEAQGED